MKLFLSNKERREVKEFKRIEKNGVRKLSSEEIKRIEIAERLHDFHVSATISMIALIFSIFNLIVKIL